VELRAGVGGVSALDHPELLACVESRARHEIFVFGFDHTQKIGVQGGHAPHPHPLPLRRRLTSFEFLETLWFVF